jgi:hypothetical protein
MAKTESSDAKQRQRQAADPVLAMLGVGKQLWESEPGDRFIERLRSEELPPSPFAGRLDAAENASEMVWQRITHHEGEEFHTATGLPFTYAMEGSGIWFFREGRRINRKLTRTQVDQAIARCPLASTTEVKDLMDYAYLFGLLMDARIRAQAW